MPRRTYDKDLSVERLNEIFGNESQIVTANRLHTSQSNVSKWKNGDAKPTTDNLLFISAIYDVSIDWILGLSDNRRTTDIDIEALTYEQVIKVLDRLLEYDSLIIPNLFDIGDSQPIEDSTDEEDYEEDEGHSKPELYDSDYMKCNDRLLSFLLRKRIKCLGIDDDVYAMWAEKNHHVFNETEVVDCRGNFNDALDLSPQSDSSGWRDRIKAMSALTEEERQELINNYKEGKQNG